MHEEDSPDYLLKVVIIGDSGVGKSNIMSRFTNDTFSPDSKTTIGVAFATKSMLIDTTESDDVSEGPGTSKATTTKKNVKLQVWDTAGQERYRALSSAYYRGALGALVVYDITSRHSLDSVPKWLEEIDRYCTQDVVVILVGNKLDLEENRCVTVEEGKTLAAKENMFFIETSAKDATNIEKAFELLSREIISDSVPDADEIKKKVGTLPHAVEVDRPELKSSSQADVKDGVSLSTDKSGVSSCAC